MLISAKYEGNKINCLHVEPMEELIAYTKELRKDPSNGWTKGRTMRHLGSYSELTILDYKQNHPGWWERAQAPHIPTRNKAWLEFFNSAWGQPTRTVEVAKHG